MAVSTKSVSEVIGTLEYGKSAGPEGIGAEYLKVSNIKIHDCITVIVFHIMFSSRLLTTSYD